MQRSRVPWGEPLDRWLSLARPIDYRELWVGLLKTAPVLVVLVGAFVVAFGRELAGLWFAPVPLVYVAATLGFAVRDLDGSGVATSIALGAAYAGLLWISGVGWAVLDTLSPILWLLGGLVALGGLVGFFSPTLHGGESEIAALHRER